MRIPLLTSSILLLATACSHQKPDDLYGHVSSPPVAVATPAPAQTAPTPAPAVMPGCQRDWECGAGSLCISDRCVAIADNPGACSNNRVHFAFDQAFIQDAEKPVLERIARCLKADHKMHILIDGNADERGTIEYNLALGDKRARAVAEYLKNLGANDEQIATVTYGKDRTLCTEHDEACWYRNRRADLVASR